MDSNGFCSSTAGPDGLWLPVTITNTTASEYTGLQMTLSPPYNVVADDTSRNLGTLGPNMTTTVFYFFDYRNLRSMAGCNNGTNGWYAYPYTLTIASNTGSLTSNRIFTDVFPTVSA